MKNAGEGVQPGDQLLLVDARDRRYLVTVKAGAQFHSHMGALSHDELIGSPVGRLVRTSGGSKLWVFRPTLADYQLKMKRGAQVVYPKDAGLILMLADIFPGATVLEAGAGSGSLTLALARAVGDGGRVISYELRSDHHEQALANVEGWYAAMGGKPDNIELRIGDVFEANLDHAVDRIVLDLPQPWQAVGTITGSLVGGGILCCYLPTVPQVMQTVEAMRNGGFGWIETTESLLRTWNVQGQSVRPDHRMVGHTGFLVIGRKSAPSE